MESDLQTMKINMKEEVEFHHKENYLIKTQLVETFTFNIQ